MSKRKKKTRRPMPIPNWMIFLSVTFVFVIFYVLLSAKIIAIGYKMEEVKSRYENLNMLNKNYRAEMLKLTSQSELLKRAEKFNIKLINPSKWCYLELNPDNSKGKKDGTAEAGTE